MIIPWLRGVLQYDRAPLTWTIFFLCNYLFLVMSGSLNHTHREYFYKEENLRATAGYYYQFQGGRGFLEQSKVARWASMGLADPRFVESADRIHFQGDQVQLAEWQDHLREYRQGLGFLPSIVFGLSGRFHGLSNLISYQFLHSGIMHLLSNMFLLLIFGAAVEVMLGSLALVLIYFGSGIFAGIFYMWISGETLSPVIGASGSISGLMAFYILYEFRKTVAYFFFVSPLPGYHGVLHLSKYWMLPLFFLADLSSVIAGLIQETPTSGVASGAHIGGLLFGLTMGGIAKAYREHNPLPQILTLFRA